MGRKLFKSSGLKDDFFSMGVRRASLKTAGMTDSPRDRLTTLVITGRRVDRCCLRSHDGSGSSLQNVLLVFLIISSTSSSVTGKKLAIVALVRSSSDS